MIRLEKAGREDLAALVQLQEMVRARLLPEGQSLPETAGDTLEDFGATGPDGRRHHGGGRWRT